MFVQYNIKMYNERINKLDSTLVIPNDVRTSQFFEKKKVPKKAQRDLNQIYFEI